MHASNGADLDVVEVRSPERGIRARIHLPDGWSGPQGSAEVAVVMIPGGLSIVSGFAPNLVLRAGAEPSTGGGAIIGRTTAPINGSDLLGTSTLAVSMLAGLAIVQLATVVHVGSAVVDVVSSIPEQEWSRLGEIVEACHASLEVDVTPEVGGLDDE